MTSQLPGCILRFIYNHPVWLCFCPVKRCLAFVLAALSDGPGYLFVLVQDPMEIDEIFQHCDDQRHAIKQGPGLVGGRGLGW